MATTSTSSSRNPGGLISRLLRRGREERLPQAAGGLTFTMVMSMVPLLALSFALFARIPALHAAGDAIREHLLRGLLPDGIARTVLKHLAQFAGNTGGLTQVGFALLLVSALALLMSVETTLNRIWQVKKPRPLLRRLGLYLGMLLTGPVLIGASLWAASYLAAASSGLPVARPGWLPHALNIGPMVLSAAGFACLFRFVPPRLRWWPAPWCGASPWTALHCNGSQAACWWRASCFTYGAVRPGRRVCLRAMPAWRCGLSWWPARRARA